MRKKYDFYSLGLIPIFTLFLSRGFGLTETNLSVIGNDGVMRLVFLGWGLITGNYFYLYMGDLLEVGNYESRGTRFLLLFSWILFLAALGLPYVPEKAPVMAKIHVEMAFWAVVVMALVMFRFLLHLQRREGKGFLWYWCFLILGCIISAVIFFYTGMITSLLEIFVTISICLFLRGLNVKLDAIQNNL